jgi:hypothetical protein
VKADDDDAAILLNAVAQLWVGMFWEEYLVALIHLCNIHIACPPQRRTTSEEGSLKHLTERRKSFFRQFVQRNSFLIALYELYFLWQGTILIRSVDHLFSAVGDMQVGCAVFETFFYSTNANLNWLHIRMFWYNLKQDLFIFLLHIRFKIFTQICI